MKYLKLFEDYKISKIGKNTPGKFQYVDGIKYKIGNEQNTLTVSIDSVQHTTENEFYPEQIEKYVKYISEGGVIESFPVEEVKIATNLVDMLEWLDDHENFDTMYDILNGTFFLPIEKNEKTPWYLPQILDKDDYPEYSRIYKRASKLEEVFPPHDRTKEEIELLESLAKVFNYFDEESEYYLIDFNHRFAAVKELGKKEVLIEIM